MIKYSEALKIIRGQANRRVVDSERLELTQSGELDKLIGRVVSRPVESQDNIPQFDNSAMDGFLVAARVTKPASKASPVVLPVSSTVFAGDRVDVSYGTSDERQAIEIMTGAPLPVGPFDAIMKIEDVEVEKDASGKVVAIKLFEAVEAGQYVRKAGQDFRAGQVALEAGTKIDAESLLAIAALGIRSVEVKRKPRIAIISTGRELVDFASENLPKGKIRNSTGPFLEVALPIYGAEVAFVKTISDDADKFETLIRRLVSQDFDLIISTGAVSMGKADFIHDSIKRAGGEILFHKVAIRPGKPILFARFGEKKGPVFFGLPGNPISTAVGLRFFIGPYLREVLGMEPEAHRSATLVGEAEKPVDLQCFYKGLSTERDGRVEVVALEGQASFMISPLLRSNCWIVLPEGIESVRQVVVYPISPS